MKLPFQIDLAGKVVVVTGAGGVICSVLAEAMAMTGAKVALLDLNEDAAKKHADDITAKGYIAKGYKCNVLEKASVQAARDQIAADFGTCDILINGAGGNNPKATTDDEYFVPEDLGQMKTFFDLDADGVSFVFSLNFMGTLIPTQVFALDMVNKKGASIINISSMNAYTPLTKIPAYSGAKAAISNFTEWLAVHFSKVGIRCNAIAPGFFSTQQNAKLLFNEDGTPTARTGKILNNTPMDRFGEVEELIGEILKRIDAERAESPGENNDIQIYKRALTKAWERLGYPGELARVRTDLVYTSEADDLEWLAERAKDGQIRKEKRAQVYKVIGDVRRKQGQTEAAFQNYLEALRQNGSGFVRTELSRIFLTDLYEGSKRAAVYAKAGDASEFLNQWLGKYGSIEEIQQLVKECL